MHAATAAAVGDAAARPHRHPPYLPHAGSLQWAQQSSSGGDPSEAAVAATGPCRRLPLPRHPHPYRAVAAIASSFATSLYPVQTSWAAVAVVEEEPGGCHLQGSRLLRG